MAPMQRPAKALPRQMTCTVVAWETSAPAKQKGKAVEMMVTWGNTRLCDCPSLPSCPACAGQVRQGGRQQGQPGASGNQSRRLQSRKL